jgi:hypothetical protein
MPNQHGSLRQNVAAQALEAALAACAQPPKCWLADGQTDATGGAPVSLQDPVDEEDTWDMTTDEESSDSAFGLRHQGSFGGSSVSGSEFSRAGSSASTSAWSVADEGSAGEPGVASRLLKSFAGRRRGLLSQVIPRTLLHHRLFVCLSVSEHRKPRRLARDASSRRTSEERSSGVGLHAVLWPLVSGPGARPAIPVLESQHQACNSPPFAGALPPGALLWAVWCWTRGPHLPQSLDQMGSLLHAPRCARGVRGSADVSGVVQRPCRRGRRGAAVHARLSCALAAAMLGGPRVCPPWCSVTVRRRGGGRVWHHKLVLQRKRQRGAGAGAGGGRAARPCGRR